ncbi:hypothetical protein ACLRGI_06585 [Paenarthrobacter nitroguajacolicus]
MLHCSAGKCLVRAAQLIINERKAFAAGMLTVSLEPELMSFW